jgi:hypothetical protein
MSTTPLRQRHKNRVRGDMVSIRLPIPRPLIRHFVPFTHTGQFRLDTSGSTKTVLSLKPDLCQRPYSFMARKRQLVICLLSDWLSGRIRNDQSG